MTACHSTYCKKSISHTKSWTLVAFKVFLHFDCTYFEVVCHIVNVWGHSLHFAETLEMKFPWCEHCLSIGRQRFCNTIDPLNCSYQKVKVARVYHTHTIKIRLKSCKIHFVTFIFGLFEGLWKLCTTFVRFYSGKSCIFANIIFLKDSESG